MDKPTIITLVALLTFVACQQNTAQPKPEPNDMKSITLSENEKQWVNSNNDFAFLLFQAAQEDKSQILSPLSITYALGMLNNGATGMTQQEINQTLGFGDAGVDAINAFCKKLLDEAPSLDNKTQVLIGNTIFTNKGYTLKTDFVTKAKEYYDAEPESRDFDDGKTLDIINQWASDHTNKMIPKVLDEQSFNPYAANYLLNAIYFKGTWKEKFKKTNTKEELFNGKEKVMMMWQHNGFFYADNNIYQSVRLPYGNGAYCMTVMLPHEDKTINDILSDLNSESWRDNKYKMHKCSVDLKLPRFETDTDIELNEILQQLGITKAFNDAEFDNLCEQNIYIDLIKQVAKIKLDEEGTEAAAVTIIGSKTSSAPKRLEHVQFYANRTFLYVITEQSTGAIFFIGKYTGK